MKTRQLRSLWLVAGFAPIALGARLEPSAVSPPSPATDLHLAPEVVRLDALSDDGRWLLLTSSSDRLVAGDANDALDVFLFDRTSGEIILISQTPDDRAGDGSSFAGGMAADASRVVFQSRAANLAPNDANRTWDVFVRDLQAGTTLLISAATNGFSGAGASTAPQASADGRYVLFTSDAPDLVALTTDAGARALFRRDLETQETEWVSRELGAPLTIEGRIEAASMTPDGNVVVFTTERRYSTGGWFNGIFLRDLRQGATLLLSTNLAAAIATSLPPFYQNPVLTPDGATVACRYTAGGQSGFLLYNRGAASVTLLGAGGQPLPTAVASQHLGPAISIDGQFVAYAQVVRASSEGEPLVQVFRWSRAPGSPTLVSAKNGTGELSNGHAFAPKISPDGRYVAFLSDATDLVADTTEATWRAYLWDANTGENNVIAELGLELPPAGWALSANGAWLGIAAAGTDGVLRVHVVNLATGQTFEHELAPAVTESTTGWGMLAVSSSGVSADGRYVSLLALPPGPPNAAALPQVYLYDTQTGGRELISRGVDGQPANAWSLPPAITADGTRVLYASHANNLVNEDTNGFRDVFLAPVTGLPHRLVRPTTTPATVTHVRSSPLLSADGRFALVNFTEGGRPAFRLLDLQTETLSSPLPIQEVSRPRFSRDGALLVAGAFPSPLRPVVQVIDVVAWLSATESPSAVVWTETEESNLPVLSRDGTRLAYYRRVSGQYTLLVVEWAQNRELLSLGLELLAPTQIELDDAGRSLLWVAPAASASAPSQVWKANVASGAVTLVSVGADGTTEGNGASQHAAISPDGRYVAFASVANNLVTDDVNQAQDIFLRDLSRGQTLLVSRGLSSVSATGWSTAPFFSRDGRSLFFLSQAGDLVGGDANQALDLFKVSLVEGSLLAVIRRSVSGGDAELLWTGQPGKTYRVEFKDALHAATWHPLLSTAGPEFRVRLDPGAAPQRFFRVVEQP